MRDIYNKCWVLKTSERGQKIKKMKRYITFNSKEGQKIEKRPMTKAKMYNTRKMRKMLSELTMSELHDICASLELSKTGVKKMIVNKISSYMTQNTCKTTLMTLTKSSLQDLCKALNMTKTANKPDLTTSILAAIK